MENENKEAEVHIYVLVTTEMKMFVRLNYDYAALQNYPVVAFLSTYCTLSL